MKLVEKGPFKIVGVEVTAQWEQLGGEMAIAWSAFFGRRSEIRDRVGEALIDVSLEQDGTRFTQLICSEVCEAQDVPAGMVLREIPAHWYVHHRHTGPVEGIAATFSEMYDWAETNVHATDGFKLDIGYTARGTRAHDLYVRVVR